MKAQINVLCLLGGLLAISTPAVADDITVIVDDDPGNDAAYSYTPGSGGVVGNFSGAGALKTVINTLRNDPNVNASATSVEVRIIDTDGVADTYIGTLNVGSNNLTIRQAPNGNGNDQPVVIQADGSLGFGNALGGLLVQGKGFAIRGLSTAQRIRVDGGPHDLPVILNVAAAEGQAGDALFENIEITDTDGGAPNDYTELNTGSLTVPPSVVFRGVRFTVGNGPQPFLDNVLFEDCEFATPGFSFVQFSPNADYVDSSFLASPGGPHLGGEATMNNATFTRCTFALGGGRILNGQDGSLNVISIDSTVRFIDPVFAGANGDVAFWLDNNNVNVIIEGSDPANPVNIDPLFQGGTLLLARVNSGSLTLRNVEGTMMGGAGFIDATAAPLFTDLAINFENCKFSNGAGRFIAADTEESGAAVHVTATNTIWAGAAPGNLDIIEPSGLHTGNDTITLNHCTLVQATANVLLASNPPGGSLTIVSNHSVFDSTGNPPQAITGIAPLDPSSVGNVRRGGGFFPGEPEGTMSVVNFSLAADGTLTPGSAFLIGNAVGSASTEDFEGDARPLPGGSSPDTGADESPLGPDDFGWPINIPKVAGSSPTVDGTISLGSEYAGASGHVVSLTGISGANVDNPAVYNDGSNFSVPFASGTVQGDADLSATVYMVYDEDALYVAVLGLDDEFNPSVNPSVNAGDVFQLAIDYDDTASTEADLDGKVVIPSWSLFTNTNDSQFFQQFWPVWGPNPMPGVTWAMVADAGAYALEARIPWGAITNNGDFPHDKPFPPVEGQTARMLILLVDFDEENAGSPGAEFSLLFSGGAGTNIISNASAYSTVTFTAAVTPGDTSDLWSVY